MLFTGPVDGSGAAAGPCFMLLLAVLLLLLVVVVVLLLLQVHASCRCWLPWIFDVIAGGVD